MRGLKLFGKISDKRTINLASFHSPHSLTWSWILSIRRNSMAWPVPYGRWSRDHFGLSFGFGLRAMFGFYTYRNNGGRQCGLTILWHELHWSRQRPMWYRDLYIRARDEEDSAKAQLHRLREEVATIKHNAARAAMNEVPAHLN